jgi:cAMP-dependent protein kinase regulator
LEEKELQIVIDAIKEMHFKPGEYVITQGDEGNCLYVVSSGQLDCTKKFVSLLIEQVLLLK